MKEVQSSNKESTLYKILKESINSKEVGSLDPWDYCNDCINEDREKNIYKLSEILQEKVIPLELSRLALKSIDSRYSSEVKELTFKLNSTKVDTLEVLRNKLTTKWVMTAPHTEDYDQAMRDVISLIDELIERS